MVGKWVEKILLDKVLDHFSAQHFFCLFCQFNTSQIEIHSFTFNYVYITYNMPKYMLMSSKIRDIGVVNMRKIAFENNKNVISHLLKRYRMMNGFTQEQVASKMQVLGVNIDQQMISKIEANARMVTDYELACFCLVLKVQPQELLADFYEKQKEE